MVIKLFKSAFSKTGSLLGNKLRGLFSKQIDEETLEKLEQILYEADLGSDTASHIVSLVKKWYKKDPNLTSDEFIKKIGEELTQELGSLDTHVNQSQTEAPTTLLIVGVNGNGKTTSVAKLASKLSKEGKKVILAAGDTFRAAATEQLLTWSERAGVEIVKGKHGSDPASVVFDSYSAAKSRGADYLIIDTAGRLHTKTHLMQELEKIKRVLSKQNDEAPHETLLVVDATTGQNAVEQAKIFNDFVPLTGVILTKLDGTSKGGCVIPIQKKIGLPIKFIGVGEGIEDLRVFDPKKFVEELLS